MNIISGSTSGHEAGVLGLAAFLSDPEACKARLAELQAAVEAADEARANSLMVAAAAEEMKLAAEELALAAKTASEKAAERMAVVEAARAEVSLKEIANVDLAKMLADKAAAQDKREADLSMKQDELDSQQISLRVAEASVVALRQEYEAKVEKLRSVVA